MQKMRRIINRQYRIILGFLATIILFAIFSLFIVKQTEQAVVFQFGEPMRTIKTAGLNIKVPFIQNIIKFDNRLQEISTEDKEVIASDQKRLVINAFVKYKITEPTRYYTTVRDNNGFKNKFSTILDSSLRQVIGEIPLNILLSDKRVTVMKKIQDVVAGKAKQFGVKIIDVRITRSDLPKANSGAIYKRMQTDREREAKEIRAEGDEMAQKIKANTDKERVYLLAEAKKQAEILMGEGEAIANKTYAKSYSKDPEFYEFYRTMQAYKKSLNSNNTKIIISQDNEFLKNFAAPKFN